MDNINRTSALVGDLNLNSLDYTTKSHVQNVLHIVFETCVFSVINHEDCNYETAIDHILTRTILDF